MPLMVTIQLWVLLPHVEVDNMTSTYFTIQLPKNKFFLIQKKHPWAGFEPGSPIINPEHTHALDRLAMAPLVIPIYFVIQIHTTVRPELVDSKILRFLISILI